MTNATSISFLKEVKEGLNDLKIVALQMAGITVLAVAMHHLPAKSPSLYIEPTPPAEIRELIKWTADRYAVEPRLALAVAKKETNIKPVRPTPEPNGFRLAKTKLQKIMNRKPTKTEVLPYAHSYGPMQVMGYYGLDYGVSVEQLRDNVAASVELAMIQLRKCVERHDAKVGDARINAIGVCYNGAGKYGKDLVKVYRRG